jgi:diacylglycerol kinase (ATP)
MPRHVNKGCAMARRALLLVNRHARSGERFHAVAVERLTTFGFHLIEPAPGEWGNDAIRAHVAEVDLVVIGGGDGSLNAAADALAECGKPLGILPLGTANDLARTLNLPTDLDAACKVIAEGHTRRIDLGRVNGQPFFNVASIGLSVEITRRLTKQSKGWLGVFAYLVAASRAVVTKRPFRAEIVCDGESHQGRTVQVTVGNGRHYGGGLTVAEDAAPDDARLDVYSLEVRHWLGLIPLLPALRRGDLKGRNRVRVLHGHTVEVHTHTPRSVTADGEVVTRTPATFTVQPGAVTVFVPREPPGEAK